MQHCKSIKLAFRPKQEFPVPRESKLRRRSISERSCRPGATAQHAIMRLETSSVEQAMTDHPGG